MSQENWQIKDSLSELQMDATCPAKRSHVSFLDKCSPKIVVEAKALFRTHGLQAVIRRYGWRLFALFFAYYLVRDSILYLLLPYLVAKGVML